MDLLHLALLVVSVVFAMTAFVVWRQGRNAGISLQARRDEVEKSKNERLCLQQELSRALGRLEEKTLECKELTQRVRDALHQRDLFKTEVQEVERRALEDRSTVSNQIDHYKTQAKALTRQLTELDQENARLRDAGQKVAEQRHEELRKDHQIVLARHDEMRELRAQAEQRAQEAQRKLAALQARLDKFDPAEAVRLRHKLSQYNQLLASMRGLKEMAEERSQNWEVALWRLTGHVLGLGPQAGRRDRPLGELVGKALEKIHANFKEEELPGPVPGAVGSAPRAGSNQGSPQPAAGQQPERMLAE